MTGLRSRRTEGRSETIGFRLPLELFRALQSKAEEQGLSVHKLAEAYVVEALGESKEDAILEALNVICAKMDAVTGAPAHSEHLAELRQQIFTLHNDFAFGVEALLHCAGQLSKKDAERWVQSIKPQE
jgi:hypothetical protein